MHYADCILWEHSMHLASRDRDDRRFSTTALYSHTLQLLKLLARAPPAIQDDEKIGLTKGFFENWVSRWMRIVRNANTLVICSWNEKHTPQKIANVPMYRNTMNRRWKWTNHSPKLTKPAGPWTMSLCGYHDFLTTFEVSCPWWGHGPIFQRAPLYRLRERVAGTVLLSII